MSGMRDEEVDDERPWLAKLDPRLRSRLDRPASGDFPDRIQVIVRFAGRLESVAARGLTIRSSAGNVATATLALDDLPRIARAPEILSIEEGRSIGPDARP